MYNVTNMKDLRKQLRGYIYPNILAMVGMSCYILADTFFISKAAGANGITALNLVLPIYNLMFAIGSMVGIGAATRYTLEKDLREEEVKYYFSNAILCLAWISVVFVSIGVFAPSQLMAVLGGNEEIIAVGAPYIRIAMIFAPAFMINYVFTAFVRNDGAPKVAMLATVSSSLANIVLDYILMFPLGMGMIGAALATAISPLISMAICATHFFSKENDIHFIWVKPSLRRLFHCSGLGVSACVGELASGVTTTVFNFLLLSIVGNVAVAAYGIIANLSLVGIAIFNAIAGGIQPLSSEAKSKNCKEDMRFILRYALVVGFVLTVVLIGLVFGFTEDFVEVFNSEHSVELASYAQLGLRVYFVGFIFAFFNIIVAGYLSSIGEGMASFVISILRGVVLIALMAFALSHVGGVLGVWLAFPVTEFVCTIISAVFIYKNR